MTLPPDVLSLANWSGWTPLAEAVASAPAMPAVYAIRNGEQVVYVDMAGERRGHGLGGRLRVYLSGRGAASGFGEAAFERALASEEWLEERLVSLRADGPTRAKVWAAMAVMRMPFEVAWATCPDRAAALFLEAKVIGLLRPDGLWNR